MIPLSLQSINDSAPYAVESLRPNYYEFFTEKGTHYAIGFEEDDVLLSYPAYQLIIANINHNKSPRDSKVRDTIVAIVDDFFRKKQFDFSIYL